MKHICFLIFLVSITGSISAQSIDANKTTKDLKRQLEIDTEEVELFGEQIRIFEKAIASGNQEEITATKLMIQQTMLREIQQGQKRYKDNSRAIKKTNRASPRIKSESNSRDQTKQTKDVLLAEQQVTYERFSSIEKASNPRERAILDKLVLSFYDILKEDLAQTKEKLKLRN